MAAAAAPPPPLSRGVWVCGTCTLENADDATICSACDGPRTGPRSRAGGSWACGACTFENTDDGSTCSVCGCPRFTDESDDLTPRRAPATQSGAVSLAPRTLFFEDADAAEKGQAPPPVVPAESRPPARAAAIAANEAMAKLSWTDQHLSENYEANATWRQVGPREKEKKKEERRRRKKKIMMMKGGRLTWTKALKKADDYEEERKQGNHVCLFCLFFL
jgi:hypothetical protein